MTIDQTSALDKAAITRFSWRRLLYLSLFAALLCALAFELPALPWREALHSVSLATSGWFVFASLIILSVIPVWAYQWCLLAPASRPIRVVVMAEIVTITSTVQNTFPFLGGPVAATAFLRLRGGIGSGAALSILAMDQLATGVAKIVFIGCALLLVPLPTAVQSGGIILLGLVVGFCFLLMVMAHGGANLDRLAKSVSRPWSVALQVLADWVALLEAMRNIGLTVLVSILALVKKSLEVAAVVAVQCGCGITPSWSSAIAVVATLSVSTMLPTTPANLGIYEATVFFVYESFNVTPANALAAAVLTHFTALLPTLMVGYLLLLRRFFVPASNQ